MPVKNAGEKYKCTVCGNEVIVNKVGGGTLVYVVLYGLCILWLFR